MINKIEILNKEEIVKRLNNNENINDIAKELKYDLTELMEEIGRSIIITSQVSRYKKNFL